MAAVEREWADGARVWPQVQTRPIDISWTLDQRSIMFLAHPRLVEGAVDPTTAPRSWPPFADPRAARRWSTSMDSLADRPAAASTPAASSSARSCSSATATWSAARSATSPRERGTTPAETAHRPRRSRRTSARGSSAPTIGHADADAVGEPARPSVRARRRERRRRARRVVRHVRRHRLPVLAVTCARPARSRLEEAVKKITLDPATIWGLPEPRPAAARATPPTSWCSTPTRSAGGRRSRPTTSPATASAGSATRSGWTPSWSDGEVTWSATEGYVAGARAGGLATR